MIAVRGVPRMRQVTFMQLEKTPYETAVLGSLISRATNSSGTRHFGR